MTTGLEIRRCNRLARCPDMGQKIQGALRGADRLGGDLQVARGGREAAMPQQQLDRAQIGTRFQEVGGKGMP